MSEDTAPEKTAPEKRAAEKTAAVLVIGDEILSGRTQDVNLHFLAGFLNELGIQVREARVVGDDEAQIVDALNTLRAGHDYVFTTGGIGPTHDDITADCVAKAFGVGIDYHPEAMAVLEAHYGDGGLNEARKRMARIPDTAALIANPVSKAPGFHIGNVFVLAGVPMIAKAMAEGIVDRLVGGARMLSRTVVAHLAEGDVSAGLQALQARFPELKMGSYPFYRAKRFGVSLVLRGTDPARLDAAAAELEAMVRSLGAEPIRPDEQEAGA